ncbi:MAG: thiamine diphosphokinase [Candidatus Puniceispirillaceae bacterium]|jgi:thiamine pyrophosphokinase
MTQQHNHQLSFTSPVLLFGAAPVMPSTLECAKQIAGWPVLAADGGLENARKCGLLPQAVIGDMDSAHDLDQLPAAVQRITLSGQDDTDFEKSLRIISAPLIVGIGFLDGRFDHALAALDTLARLPDDQPILLVGNHDVLLRLRGDFSAALPVASRLSVWPLGRQHFLASTGLEWPLDDIHMAFGTRTGTSNRVIDQSVSIQPATGDGYAVIAPFDAFDAMLDAAMRIT